MLDHAFTNTPGVLMMPNDSALVEIKHSNSPVTESTTIGYTTASDFAEKLGFYLVGETGGVWRVELEPDNPLPGQAFQVVDISGTNQTYRVDEIALTSTFGYKAHAMTNSAYEDPFVMEAISQLSDTVSYLIVDPNPFTACLFESTFDLVTGSGTGRMDVSFQIFVDDIRLIVKIFNAANTLIGSAQWDTPTEDPFPGEGWQCDRYYQLGRRVSSDFSATGPTEANPSQPQPGEIIDWDGAVSGQMNPEAGGPIRPPPAAAIFSWSAGDVSKATYDAWLATMPPNATTNRPQPGDNLYKLFLPNSHALSAPIRYEMPTMDSGSNILRMRQWSTHHDDHTMLSGESPSNLLDWRYCLPGQNYRFKFGLSLETANFSPSQWSALDWCQLWELHPGGWGGPWVGHKNAPIAIYVDSGDFRLHVRGSTQQVPTNWTTDIEYPWALSTGYHTFEVDVVIDYRGVNSLVKVTMDGVLRYTITHENGINAGGNTVLGSMFHAFGAYSSTTGPEVTFDYYEITEF